MLDVLVCRCPWNRFVNLEFTSSELEIPSISCPPAIWWGAMRKPILLVYFFDPFIPLQFHFTPSSCLLLPLLNLPSHLWLYLKQTCHMYSIITMPSHEVPWGIFILHVSLARSDIQYFHFRFGDACCYPWNSLSTVSLTQLHLPSCHPIFVLLPCHHITWKNEYLFLRSVLTSIWVSFPSLLTFFSTPRVKNWTSVSVIRKL